MIQKYAWCVWITGLPGSGKSVIARTLLNRLKDLGVHAQIVSSDMLRRVVTPEAKYTEDERDMVYRSIVFVARLLTQNGVNVIIDATGNRRKYRNHGRKEIARFLEAYVRCPLKVCIERETERKEFFLAPKDVYKKAFTEKSTTVPGIGVPYEEPLQPDVTVDSDKLEVDECATRILHTLREILIS